MNQAEKNNSENQNKNWLERLAQALLGEPQDREQLLSLLRDSEQRNLFDSDALGMIEGVLQVSEMQARDIMVPRSQMVVLERDSDIINILPIVSDSNHSRFPVIGDSLDEVIGILLAKDLLPYFGDKNKSKFYLRDIIRQAIVIPESKRLNILLNEFRASRNHMAIVVDEYGGVSGLVTIEDVLEQIVGDIEDEHDIDEDAFIKDHGDQNYTIKALTPIEDFNEYFSSNFKTDEYDTLGGLLLARIGHLPKRGDLIEIEGFHFKILRADNRRIHLLYMTIISENQVGISAS
ncbi:Magnesium and cobalt efflux protein CorC [hydrothermal vent metagenome]|uniref:Magnesium and cobalt efflux protein CorC n=1 Tax=hydrothermal vent metagenome TaxID=652676 RepID=A0A3B1A5Q6_9ZZZZ